MRSTAVSSALSLGWWAFCSEVKRCCSWVTIGPRTITTSRSWTSRAVGWRDGVCGRAGRCNPLACSYRRRHAQRMGRPSSIRFGGSGQDRDRDRSGPWVASLVAAGYEVSRSTMSTARYRERHSTSRAKSDPGDAHVLAEIVRLDRSHHRPVAGDSDDGEAMKLVARSHQTHDLGPDQARTAPAQRAARVLPGRVRRLRRSRCARRARGTGCRAGSRPCGATVHGKDQHGAAQGEPS